jgi:arylsulfatase A-like enzyme
VYEGGIRVPLLVRWPGHVRAGVESAQLTYFPDWMPTFAELAGIEPPAGIDGLSIVPTLLGRGVQDQHRYLYWEWDRYDWSARAVVPGGRMQAVREGSWKAVRHREDAPLELYDLSVDIGEQLDLASVRPEIAARLANHMREAHVDLRPQEEPERIDGRPFR